MAEVELQTNMADYRLPLHQIPQRKPVPGGNSGLQFQSGGSHGAQQLSPNPSGYHSRTRTSSSTVLPLVSQGNRHSVMQPPFGGAGQYDVSRRLSTGTTSTNSTGGNGQPSRHPSNVSSTIHRSSSQSSGGTTVSYVALMRKQKATVWCDRAQPEDPRIQAQRRAARKRANLEVHGGAPGSGRTKTLGSNSMVGKIRHGSSKTTSTYGPASLVGAGVPLRLSANEVGNAEDDGEDPDPHMLHRRTNSGRSSIASNRFPSGYQRPQQGRFSSSSSNTPPNETDIPEVAESQEHTERTTAPKSLNESEGRLGSSHSSEREESFGQMTELSAPSGAVTAAKNAKKNDDLKRRGSVDERTSTMTGVRLFIANPDLSD